MAIYIRYDGDFRDSTSSGLIHDTHLTFDMEQQDLARRKDSGELSVPEHKALAAKLLRRRNKAIEELEDQKAAELAPLKRQEAKIRSALRK